MARRPYGKDNRSGGQPLGSSKLPKGAPPVPTQFPQSVHSVPSQTPPRASTSKSYEDVVAQKRQSMDATLDRAGIGPGDVTGVPELDRQGTSLTEAVYVPTGVGITPRQQDTYAAGAARNAALAKLKEIGDRHSKEQEQEAFYREEDMGPWEQMLWEGTHKDKGLSDEMFDAKYGATAQAAEQQAAAAKAQLAAQMGASGFGASGMKAAGMGNIDAQKATALADIHADMQMENFWKTKELEQNDLQMALSMAQRKGDRKAQKEISDKLFQWEQQKELMNMMFNAPNKLIEWMGAKGMDSASIGEFMGDLREAYEAQDFGKMMQVLSGVSALQYPGDEDPTIVYNVEDQGSEEQEQPSDMQQASEWYLQLDEGERGSIYADYENFKKMGENIEANGGDGSYYTNMTWEQYLYDRWQNKDKKQPKQKSKYD